MGLFLGWGAKWDTAGGLGPTRGWMRGEGVCGVAGSQLGDLGKPQMGFGEAAITGQVLGSPWWHWSLAAGLAVLVLCQTPKSPSPVQPLILDFCGSPSLIPFLPFDPFDPLLSAVAALLATGSGK